MKPNQSTNNRTYLTNNGYRNNFQNINSSAIGFFQNGFHHVSQPVFFHRQQPCWGRQQVTQTTNQSQYFGYYTAACTPSQLVSPSHRRCQPINKCTSIPMWPNVRAVPLSFLETNQTAGSKNRTNLPSTTTYRHKTANSITPPRLPRKSKLASDKTNLSWFFDPHNKKRDIVSSWFDDVICSSGDASDISDESTSDEMSTDDLGDFSPRENKRKNSPCHFKRNKHCQNNGNDTAELSPYLRINYSNLYPTDTASRILKHSLLSESIDSAIRSII
uniref:Uncharacterized protein n=1 Tax=Ciona savignyi TaxID=51511 RepID=H2ZFZ1_CIOSA